MQQQNTKIYHDTTDTLTPQSSKPLLVQFPAKRMKCWCTVV